MSREAVMFQLGAPSETLGRVLSGVVMPSAVTEAGVGRTRVSVVVL